MLNRALGALATAGLLVASPLAAQNTAASAPTATAVETMRNDTVVQLVQAGLDQQTVVAKIRASKTEFDLSTDGLIALKSKGVPNAVIAAMLGGGGPVSSAPQELSMDSADPMVPHYPGLYMAEANAQDGKMTRINPTVSNQAKTGGIFGYALTMGIASMSIKAAIPGDSAKVQTANKKPVFFAYFEESVPRGLQNSGSSQWANGIGTVTSSPSEVTLVRFVEKKGRREAQVGSMNIAGAKSGVMDQDQVPFDSEMLAPGIFRVTPRAALAPGEYGFVQSISGNNQGGAMTARVFDFGIQ